MIHFNITILTLPPLGVNETRWVSLTVLTAHANNFKDVAIIVNIDTVVQLIWLGEGCKLLGQAVLPKQETTGQITRLGGIHTCPTQTDLC